MSRPWLGNQVVSQTVGKHRRFRANRLSVFNGIAANDSEYRNIASASRCAVDGAVGMCAKFSRQCRCLNVHDLGEDQGRPRLILCE